MNTITELKPLHTKQKSFYGKAQLKETSDGMELFSYNTLVSKYYNNGSLKVTHDSNYLTNTTLRHINEFIQQMGYSKKTKKEIINNVEEL